MTLTSIVKLLFCLNIFNVFMNMKKGNALMIGLIIVFLILTGVLVYYYLNKNVGNFMEKAYS